MGKGLAQALWTARLEGTLASLDEADRPATESAAYEIQNALTALAEAPPVGWKLGATNEQTLELLGMKEPFPAPLLERFCFASGSEIPLSWAHRPALETEVMVSLGADLPPEGRPWNRDNVVAAVATVSPSFEIVGLRIADAFSEAGLMLIADAGANVAMIHGGPVEGWEELDLSNIPLKVSINAEKAASASTGVLLWEDAIDAVVWLANHHIVAERGLESGDMIMTGTCAGLLPIKPGDYAVADFGELGEVRATFT